MLNRVKNASLGLILILALGGCGSPPKNVTKEERGRQTFSRRCSGCHMVKGKGGRRASELTHIASRRDAKWLEQFLRNPKSVAPQTRMRPPNLSEDQIDDVTAYLATLK